MAVKKSSTKKATKIEEVEVEVANEEVELTVEEVNEEPIEEIVEVEVEEPATEEIEVDSKAIEVDDSKKPKGNVKIRMRTTHRCTIAMVRYDLEEGKTYSVPENVKRILDKAGLLAPLN